MSIIHSSWVPVGFRDAEIDGSAKLSTVASTATSSTGSIKTASAVHSRAPALMAWSAATVVEDLVTARDARVVDMVHSSCSWCRIHITIPTGWYSNGARS